MKKSFLLIILIAFSCLGQTRNPDIILNNVKQKFEEVKDYIVNVKIKIDVDFLKAPVSEAKIYFKQPDKIHIESENFALLPKEGINFSPMSLLKGNYTAIYEKKDTVDGIETAVIRIIPLEENSNVVLTTLWIDQSKNFIRKVESTTKANGSFSIDLNYKSSIDDYPLPSSMIFTFNINRNMMNRGMQGKLNGEEKNKEQKSTTGKVYINYSDYKVNQGLPDSIFEKKKNE
jgi:outer membrane lipoprotein-sorting protein